MQNLVLYRLRLRGANFSALNAVPTSGMSYDSQTLVKMMINQGYQEFLSNTKDYPIAVLKVLFSPPINAKRIPLSPLPPYNSLVGFGTASVNNPAVMKIYEMTYYPGSAGLATPTTKVSEYLVSIVSTDRFKSLSGGYIGRTGATGQRSYYASQLNGSEDYLDIYPGVATALDTATMTICPDPQKTADYYSNLGLVIPAANGGQLVGDLDVPLIPSQFHMALVEYAVMNMGDAHDRQEAVKNAGAKWDAYLQQAEQFGVARGVGDPEQRISEGFATSYDWLG